MAEITLRKYHGLGNDYLIYDPNRNACELQERQVEALCRRNLGVGADGILYGPFFDGDKMRVRIFNPDGSEAEKSGNGIRIFSKYLKDMGYVTEESYVLHTKAGETRVTFLNEQGDLMRVDMGYPEFVAKEIPVVGFEGEIVNEAIFFGDNFYNDLRLPGKSKLCADARGGQPEKSDAAWPVCGKFQIFSEPYQHAALSGARPGKYSDRDL